MAANSCAGLTRLACNVCELGVRKPVSRWGLSGKLSFAIEGHVWSDQSEKSKLFCKAWLNIQLIVSWGSSGSQLCCTASGDSPSWVTPGETRHQQWHRGRLQFQFHRRSFSHQAIRRHPRLFDAHGRNSRAKKMWMANTGAATQAKRSLQRSGLPENGCRVFLKRSRNHVHLSADIETAKKVGARCGTPPILPMLVPLARVAKALLFILPPPHSVVYYLAVKIPKGTNSQYLCWPAVHHPPFLDYPNEFRFGTDVAERNLTGPGMLPKVVLEPRASNPIPIKVTDSGFLRIGDVPSDTQNKNK